VFFIFARLEAINRPVIAIRRDAAIPHQNMPLLFD
jgi:hypothetical protein